MGLYCWIILLQGRAMKPEKKSDREGLYAAVELEEEDVGGDDKKVISTIVPLSWISDERRTCRWPRHMPEDFISNYVVRQKKPKLHWSFCKVRKVVVLACE